MYDVHHNFLVYGYGRNGFKTDFGGHDMTARSNVYAWLEINQLHGGPDRISKNLGM
jgi:hypothetical protein